MKQRIHIVADDGDTKIVMTAFVICRKQRKGYAGPLSADEQRGIKRTLQRRLADVVRGITHTSFGPENTKVG